MPDLFSRFFKALQSFGEIVINDEIYICSFPYNKKRDEGASCSMPDKTNKRASQFLVSINNLTPDKTRFNVKEAVTQDNSPKILYSRPIPCTLLTIQQLLPIQKRS